MGIIKPILWVVLVRFGEIKSVNAFGPLKKCLLCLLQCTSSEQRSRDAEASGKLRPPVTLTELENSCFRSTQQLFTFFKNQLSPNILC